MEREKIDELIGLLSEKRFKELKDELITYNEADIAIFFESIDSLKAVAVFRLLPKDIAAETFSFFSVEMQNHMIESMTNIEITEIVDRLYIDDAVDMLEELPANVVSRVMANISGKKRSIINQYLQYPKDSAGSIMTAEYLNVTLEDTVGKAIQMIRDLGMTRESIYSVYITDEKMFLEGFVSVRSLLLNEDDVKLKELIEEDVIYVRTDDDQEYVARQFAKYGFLALPVVDKEGRLVGLVTVDDAIDVLEEEATEDFEKMAAMTPSEKPYLKTSVFALAKNRLTWLLFLMLSASFTGLIINSYEHFLLGISGISAFVPMLTGSGGNAGAQASTVEIRSMAIGEVDLHDYPKVLVKEIGVGFIVGAGLAIVNFIRVIIFHPGQYMVSLTVSLALMATIIISKLVGCTLPMVAKKLNLDPTIMAAPLLTTVVDSMSLLVYVYFVKSILY